MEPLAARPLQYLKMGLIFGGAIWYWDYLRRVMIENAMEGEEKMRYTKNLRAINFNLRVGDEDEVSNLTEYLASTTTRMWTLKTKNQEQSFCQLTPLFNKKETSNKFIDFSFNQN